MIKAGELLFDAGIIKAPAIGLPQEWWDFRLPAEIFEQYAPLSDAELPPQMRMTDAPVSNDISDLPEEHFSALKQKLVSEID